MSKKILIVDDEPDLVAYLQSLLKDNGYDTVTAEDGKEGMEKARSEKPDLITLDISMPEESGVKMYRELQDDPATANIPIVIVTGLSSDFKRFLEHLERKKQISPPAAYFEKPIDKEEMLSKFREILG
ncbi:MAG: response regulator [candidate division Zixibacteria bacterium]|nr:response regulator [Candidatus Tariuqbacter arcticus]